MSYYKGTSHRYEDYGKSSRPYDDYKKPSKNDDYGKFSRSYDSKKSSSSRSDRDHGRYDDDSYRSSSSSSNDNIKWYREERRQSGSSSRGNGRSYGNDRQMISYSGSSSSRDPSISSRDRCRGSSQGRGQSRSIGFSNYTRDPLLFAYRENLLNGYLDKRVRIEIMARHKKLHIYIGTFIGYDLVMNVVLSDCYKVHRERDQKPMQEDMKGLLLLRGSCVLSVRHCSEDQPMRAYVPDAAPGTCKSKKKNQKAIAAAGEGVTKSVPALKLKRSWKSEGKEKKILGLIGLKIKEEVKQEVNDEWDDAVLIKKERSPNNSDDVMLIKKESSDDSDDVVLVKKQPRIRCSSSESDDVIFVKQERRNDSSDSDVVFVKQEVECEADYYDRESALKKEKDLLFGEFMNTSGPLTVSDTDCSD